MLSVVKNLKHGEQEGHGEEKNLLLLYIFFFEILFRLLYSLKKEIINLKGK